MPVETSTAEEGSRRAAAEKLTTGAPAIRASSADFQSPWTSTVASGAKSFNDRRSRATSRQWAGENGLRRHPRVSARKTRAREGLPSRRPSYWRSISHPTVAPPARAFAASGSV